MSERLQAFLEKHEIPSEDFEFQFRGETYRARRLHDATDIIALEKKGRTMIRICTDRPSPAWQEWLPASEAVIRAATICEALIVDPAFTFCDWLRIGKSCGMALLAISAEVMTGAGVDLDENEEEAIDEAKNESGAADTGTST